ncbi:MAG: helix-turn-helix domain-containing protein [Blautia sp.]
MGEYIKKKKIRLSKISRETGIPYTALYDSFFNKSRNRDLRLEECLRICDYLQIDPMLFYYGKN